MALAARVVVLLALLRFALPAGATELRTISVRFRVVASADAPWYYRPRPEAELRAIALPTSAPSPAWGYEGPSPLELFGSAVSGPPAVSIPVPPGATRILVVIPPASSRPDVGGRPGAAALVIADDLSSVPLSTVTLLNVADQPYQLTYGDERREVGPLARATLPAQSAGRLIVSARVGGGWRQVTVHDLEVEENARAWVILWPPYRAGQLQPRLRVMFDEGQ